MDIITIFIWLAIIAVGCFLLPYAFSLFVILLSVLVTALTVIYKGFAGLFKRFGKA